MKKNIIGIILCVAIAVVSRFIAHYILIGGVTTAIILGLLTGNLIKLPEKITPGINFSEKKILSWAIALMGFRLNYSVLANLGIPVVILIVAGVIFTISFSLILGRLLGMEKDLSLLLGIGNSVCGSSAIAAAQSVIKTRDEHVGVSVAVINLLGTVGIFLLPFLAISVPGLSGKGSGVLIGNTLQAIGQVTAAGFSLDDSIGQTAMIVKMGRILMITPLVILLNLKRNGTTKNKSHLPKIPSYILLFILFSLIASRNIIPESIIDVINRISEFLLVTAMSAVGLNITFRDLLTAGRKALLAGSLTFAGQILFSGSLILLFLRIGQ